MKKQKYDIDFPLSISDMASKWYENKDISGLSDRTISLIEQYKIKGNCIDIACGSGYFAMNLAKKIQVNVTGVDIHEPFINSAIKISEIENLSCNFILHDANDFIKNTNKSYDIATALATGEILGNLIETLKKIRGLLTHNGFYFIGWSELEKSAKIEIAKLTKFVTETLNDDIILINTESSICNFEKDLLKINEIRQEYLGNSEIENWAKNKSYLLNSVNNQVFQSVIFIARKK